MLLYAIRRILVTIPVMVFVAFFVFSLLFLTPGDPAALIAGDQASPADIARIRETLGLDRPFSSSSANGAGASCTVTSEHPSSRACR